jgi:nicotinic acid mononucleotide adenylyltransferase
VAHEAIIYDLLNHGFFDKVIVKPCGVRLDKPELLAQLEERTQWVKTKLSRPASHYQLILSGMSAPMRPTVMEWEELQAEYRADELYLVAGTDLFLDEGEGKCQIQRWVEGERLFQSAHFYIYPRPVQGELIYPPRYVEQDTFLPINISSSMLRAQQKAEQQ